MRLFLFFSGFLFFTSQIFADSYILLQYSGDSLEVSNESLNVISTHPETFLAPLSSEIDENSGLIFWREKIWTHNDSGGDPCIYAIDTATGEILQTLTIKNAMNFDWEDISQDEEFIYVGDFGNNRGTRKELRVYKIPKKNIPENGNMEIDSVDVISFSYGDQQDFTKRTNRHNFDCEAMVSLGENLVLFSKNWADQQTKVYLLPKNPGSYEVNPYATFNAEGLITGAALSPDHSLLALVGYVDYESFIWLFSNFEGNDFFSGKILRVNFPELVFVQTEGVCFISDEQILFSCEESAEQPTLFLVNTEVLKAIAMSGTGAFLSTDIVISGMPSVVSKKLKVDVLELPETNFSFELRNTRWDKLFVERAVKKKNQKKFKLTIITRDLKNGLYFLRISSGEHTIIKKVRVEH